MKCQGCGHEYPSTFPRCSRCGELTPRRTLRPPESRLIEFPRKTRVDVEKETASSLPSWRRELNEKVRAIKARRTSSSAEVPPVASNSIPNRLVSGGNPDPRQPRHVSGARASRSLGAQVAAEPIVAPPSPPRTSNAIVEAALTRVRRATENATRASLARIEPVRPIQPKANPPISVDREATARALDVTVDSHPKPEATARPMHSPTMPRAAVLSASPVRSRLQEPSPLDRAIEAPPLEIEAPVSEDLESISEQVCVAPLDELEPLDYLQAEVRKIDRARDEEFAHNESPSLGVHAIIHAIDLVTVGLSSAPFMAVIQIMDGSFGDGRTQIAAGLIVLLVSFFYLAITQCLTGKTFGMMLTNTRVVDIHTCEAPSGQRLLLRTIGYFVALAPVTIGLLWIGLNRSRRGWHDLLSGTRVVRDF